MTQPEALLFSILILGVCAFLLWVIPTDCRCPHCPYHKRKREEEQRAKTQKRHDEMHWGPPGMRTKGLDLHDCWDPECPRNQRRR